MIFIREHGTLIVTIICVALIITAGSLENPPFWLGLGGWLSLAVLLNLYVLILPNSSVFKGPFFLAELALLFGTPLSPHASRLLSQLVFSPSPDILLDFLSTKTFLLVAVVYFATACGAYRTKLQKAEDEIYRHQQDREDLERLRQWRLEQILRDAETSDDE